MVWEGANQFLLQRQWNGGDPYRFQAAAAAIAEDSQPGDIVYNVDWGYFPELFFWNTKNYYVSGLDPIFLYAYNPNLYWEAHHLQAGDSGRVHLRERDRGGGEAGGHVHGAGPALPGAVRGAGDAAVAGLVQLPETAPGGGGDLRRRERGRDAAGAIADGLGSPRGLVAAACRRGGWASARWCTRRASAATGPGRSSGERARSGSEREHQRQWAVREEQRHSQKALVHRPASSTTNTTVCIPDHGATSCFGPGQVAGDSVAKRPARSNTGWGSATRDDSSGVRPARRGVPRGAGGRDLPPRSRAEGRTRDQPDLRALSAAVRAGDGGGAALLPGGPRGPLPGRVRGLGVHREPAPHDHGRDLQRGGAGDGGVGGAPVALPPGPHHHLQRARPGPAARSGAAHGAGDRAPQLAAGDAGDSAPTNWRGSWASRTT